MTRVETVICPPFVFLANVKCQKSSVKIGSQDVFYEKKGAYTGEISPAMLKDLGVKYVIVGHSERRALGETDEIINKKAKTALEEGFKVILCVGEKERDLDGEYLNFLRAQINDGLKGISKKFLANVIIAYEPIWAISSGTGAKADNPESAMQTAIFIRRELLPIIGNQAARNTPVLYGGSVNPENAGGFLGKAGMSGLLVGEKSLSPEEFSEILKIANILK
jgi:triosephosphate isomerase